MRETIKKITTTTAVELGTVCGVIGFLLGLAWGASAVNAKVKEIDVRSLQTEAKQEAFEKATNGEMGKVNVTLTRILTVLEVTGGMKNGQGKNQETGGSGR